MRTSIRISSLLGLAAAIGLGLSGAARGEPPPRAPVDALWEQYMLEGRLSSIAVAVRQDSHLDISESASNHSFESASGRPEWAASNSYGITVMRLGEGLWGNGGWVVKGGLLDRTSDESVFVELYGKAVVRRFPYFPFPFHRNTPQETGYEFFLLYRQRGTSRVGIVRKWVFLPNEVVVKRDTTGGTHEDMHGALRYEAGTRVATVTVRGLTRPFDERVDLSSTLDAAPR